MVEGETERVIVSSNKGEKGHFSGEECAESDSGWVHAFPAAWGFSSFFPSFLDPEPPAKHKRNSV